MPEASVIIILLANALVLVVSSWAAFTVKRLDDGTKTLWRKVDHICTKHVDLGTRVTVLETRAGE